MESSKQRFNIQNGMIIELKSPDKSSNEMYNQEQ